MLSTVNFVLSGMCAWSAVVHYKQPAIAGFFLCLAVVNFGFGIKNAIMELN